jgi:predicted membrane GTPase involved in stress response
MHHEGFKVEVGPPTFIYKENAESGKIEEQSEIAEICITEKQICGIVDLLNTHKVELQDVVIEDGKGRSIMKYLGLTPGILCLCSAMPAS